VDLRSTCIAANQKLNDLQEAALVTHYNRMDHLGVSAKLSMVDKVAYLLLVRSHTNPTTPPPIVGPKWVWRFRTGHLEQHKISRRARS
jgi:hypothetical protein